MYVKKRSELKGPVILCQTWGGEHSGKLRRKLEEAGIPYHVDYSMAFGGTDTFSLGVNDLPAAEHLAKESRP